jgi:hypothetical protein
MWVFRSGATLENLPKSQQDVTCGIQRIEENKIMANIFLYAS